MITISKRRHRSQRWIGAGLLLALLGARGALASEGTDVRSPDANQKTVTTEGAAAVEPPRMRLPKPVLRPEGTGTGERSVVLKITLDDAGNVKDAAVTESSGDAALDAVALESILGSVFEPARRAGEPVPSRIFYTYVFEAAAAVVTGRVASGGTGGIAGAEIRITAADGTVLTVRSDESGVFRVEGVPPGECRVEISAAGFGQAATVLKAEPPATELPPVILSPSGGEAPIEVTVRGISAAQRLRRSAEAVQVIETGHAKRETSDLGEVMARQTGVNVRRSGGLGSGERFFLNGFGDDQIRHFMDGVPIEYSGFSLGLSNVPVNLVERVEVYRGVVPVRFGADALGGATNLVTDEDIRGTHGSASYQFGSFNTHRVTGSIRHLDEETGLFGRVAHFYDFSDNDYKIDVETPDAVGKLHPARVRRFHDGYRAWGVVTEAGVTDKPWAERLFARFYVTDYDKELQHNTVMTVPYGEAAYGEGTWGVNVRYVQPFGAGFRFDGTAGYSSRTFTFLDMSDHVYDWYGEQVYDRPKPGEIDGSGYDQVIWEDSGYGRLNLSWALTDNHTLRLSAAPTLTARKGDDRTVAPSAGRDPLSADRKLFTHVSGLEYQGRFFGEALETILFVKDYWYKAKAEDPVPSGSFVRQDRDDHQFGAGLSVRYRLTEWMLAKASWEHAVRHPRPDETFGDGFLIFPNLLLEPEKSENFNLGLALDLPETGSGGYRGELNGFYRGAKNLIVLLGNDRFFAYQNVYTAIAKGVEAAAGWTSPGEYLSLDANTTYLDLRNNSSKGTFGAFNGDRIPNRPWLFTNLASRIQFKNIAMPGDEISLGWNFRYVREFFRGWESLGITAFKQVVPSQTTHSVALTYAGKVERCGFSGTFEIDNLTDSKVFDSFGVQKPGRAYYAKATLEF